MGMPTPMRCRYFRSRHEGVLRWSFLALSLSSLDVSAADHSGLTNLSAEDWARVFEEEDPGAIRQADLEHVGHLGKGAFGTVTLQADRQTGRTYALKAISKSYLAQLGMQSLVLREKATLQLVESPFVIRLHATYHDHENVYFLLEAALGGELFSTYHKLRLYGNETHARFYVACVTEGLAHLHQRSIMYRDLKPENLMLDAKGYCKLADFGLAKVALGLSYTLVGTPDYMAPEMIMRSGHGHSADWWTLGVLLFELFTGRAPFEADTIERTHELVIKGVDHIQFPSSCRGAAADLVVRLCRQNPEERLTVPALRDHFFFWSFDWAALQTLKMQPPLLPTVMGPRDLSNFEQCDQDMNAAIDQDYLPPPPTAPPPPPPIVESARIRDEGASEVERHEIKHPYMSGVEGYLHVEVGEAVLLHHWEGADEWEAGGWCYGCAETNSERAG